MNAERPNAVNAAVVGVGNMGRHHARVYSELPDVNLVGVYDVDDATAREVAEAHGTRAMNMEALLTAADVASVAVPTPFHAEIAEECIDHGVDVLVEKPFVEDPEVGRDLVDRADEAGVTIQVGHVERFNPAIRALSDIVADLDVIALDTRRLGPPPEGRQLDQSVVLDLMIHDIDVVLSILGEDPHEVSAHGAKENQYATATLGFGDDTVASLTASRVTQQRVRKLGITAEECRVNVDYVDRSIEIHRHSLPEYIEDNGDVRYRHESIVERPTVETGEPLKNELRAFVSAAVDGTEPVVSGEDGLRVLEIAREIDRIARGEAVEPEVSAR
ncbi:Gfo/Idh/MocA family oxidoreductase [Halorussus salilacus]|uniref:Gfo/Idh/MocA family protein n=1 Tax=Halorussus salilacus TaxID=2953750 RepID=UPI00209DDA93|nr:Gfo/Idh/MocA family oxidoreductase [Halorussus salilacus]USZ68096.1 Gfo/Idh/MocA family oxidoreductase [Halorussus salilacus]